MHECPHPGPWHGILRREFRGLRRNFVEIFDDDRRIDDDRAVMVESRYYAVRIQREIIRFELIAGEQVELDLVKRNILGVEREAHALAASRLRCVVKCKRHGARRPKALVKIPAPMKPIRMMAPPPPRR